MVHLKSEEIAAALDLETQGSNVKVLGVCSLANPRDYHILFANNFSKSLTKFKGTIICKEQEATKYENYRDITLIISYNPRLTFAKVAQRYFTPEVCPSIHKSSIIEGDTQIDDTATIGRNCVIRRGVKIGKRSVLHDNIVIAENVEIGDDCIIKSGALIGEDGFGFVRDSSNIPIKMPHFGKVIISNNVEIGAGVTIARGTLDNTVIYDDVKIDDQVHIAHNCIIGPRTIITSSAELSGGVVLEGDNWVGPNSSIIQKIFVGKNATIGIGAVVNSDVPQRGVVMGVPAMTLRALAKLRKMING